MTSKALRQQYPDEPWKWDKRWADGVIRDGGPGAAIYAWVFAVIWNGCTVPVTVLVMRDPQKLHHGPPLLLMLLFPACGVLLIATAILQTVRALRFGRSELTLTPFPAHPGEPLNASVRVHASLAGAQDVVAKLQCVRREQRGSGKNASTFDNILWEDTQHAPIGEDLSDTLLRATFNPDFNALETSRADLKNIVVWRLIVRGVRKGIDYNATFELPMFKRRLGDASAGARPFPRSAVLPPVTGLPTTELAAQRIHIRLLAGKAFAVDFPAGRRVVGSLVIVIFGLLFLGVSIGFALPNGWYGPWNFQTQHGSTTETIFELLHQAFRLPFIVGFGFFGLIFSIIGMSMLFTGVTATADRSGLAVVRHFLGIPFRRSLNASDIVSIASHESETIGNQVYYSVRAQTRDGKTFDFGSGIEDRHVADRLATALLETVRTR